MKYNHNIANKDIKTKSSERKINAGLMESVFIKVMM